MNPLRQLQHIPDEFPAQVSSEFLATIRGSEYADTATHELQLLRAKVLSGLRYQL